LVLAKDPGKMIGVGETTLVGDLSDSEAGGIEQNGGMIGPFLIAPT